MLVKVESEEQIRVAAELAEKIWREHFTSLIGEAQVTYMLDKFQSFEAITDQIKNQGYLYHLLEDQGKFVGYTAWQIRESELFVSKVYVLSKCRGRGFGRFMIEAATEFARENGLGKLSLTVNRGNSIAVEAYKKIGFRIAKEVDMDIGHGFVMDDYVMELEVG